MRRFGEDGSEMMSFVMNRRGGQCPEPVHGAPSNLGYSGSVVKLLKHDIP
jgi:hypothetical protein